MEALRETRLGASMWVEAAGTRRVRPRAVYTRFAPATRSVDRDSGVEHDAGLEGLTQTEEHCDGFGDETAC